MNKLVALIISGSLLCSASLFAATTTIAWGAQTDNGVGTATGTPLSAGDLVMIGTFVGLTNAQIATASFATLQADWQQVGSTVIGEGATPDGYWTGLVGPGGQQPAVSISGLGLVGSEIYYWVLDASSFAGATQQGIFTAPSGSTYASHWTFLDDSTIPQSITNDLDQVPQIIAEGGILVGNFGTGTAFTYPLYNLANIAAVPEPSTYSSALLGLCGIGLASIRRRFKK